MKSIETLTGPELGDLLEGFGINLLVSNVSKTVSFLTEVLGFVVLRASEDYAVLEHRGVLYQLHPDSTYSTNPLPSLLPENGARGAGVELRLYQIDPDTAAQKARELGYVILQEATDKPHGLRESYLLDPDGYCWVPSVKI